MSCSVGTIRSNKLVVKMLVHHMWYPFLGTTESTLQFITGEVVHSNTTTPPLQKQSASAITVKAFIHTIFHHLSIARYSFLALDGGVNETIQVLKWQQEDSDPDISLTMVDFKAELLVFQMYGYSTF